MSEKFLPQLNREEHAGFSSALFINLCDYERCNTPVRDSVGSMKLSIESFTPGHTPKADKKFSESNFKFCLSKDLLARLSECSPMKTNEEREERHRRGSDIYLASCSLNSLNEEDEGNKYEEKLNFETPSAYPSTYYSEEGKSLNMSPEEFYSNPTKNSFDKFEKDSNFDEMTKQYKSENVKKKINFEESPDRSNQGSVGNLVGNMNVNTNGLQNRVFYNYPNFSSNTCSQENPFKNSTFMYGKPGWTCTLCKNFNYEGKFFLKFFSQNQM